MHQCLHIQEIAENICEQGFHDPDDQGKRGILAFAQTCRSLYEPAANVIWYRIESLRPLVDCLPETLWNCYEDQDNTTCVLQPHDLQHVQKFTKRVRAFGYDSKKFNEIFVSPDPYPVQDINQLHYEAFALANGSCTFLPNVREVSIVDPDSIVFTHADLFTNSGLKTLRLLWSNVDEESADDGSDLLHLVDFLVSMKSRYPNLRELDIRLEGPPVAENIRIAIQDALRSFRWESLSAIHLQADLHPNLLLDLALCAPLQTLEFRSECTNSRHTLLEHQDLALPLLSELEVLTISLPYLSTVVDFLRLLSPRSQTIHTMELWSHYPEYSSSEDWEAMVSAVHDRCDPLTLAYINLDDTCDQDEIAPHVDLGHQYGISLRGSPLLEFRLLIDVRIRTFGVLDIDDHLIGTIVTSWPNIQFLSLLGQHPLNLPPKVTLGGLRLFADYSPYLCTLSIEFNGVAPNPLKYGVRPRFGDNMKELHVQRSPLDKPGPVAALLADLFPNMNIVLEENLSIPDWKLVKELHPIFVSTRCNEMDRCRSFPAFL